MNDKMVIDMITFLLLIFVITLELAVTYFNGKRYKKLCDDYIKKYGIIHPGAVSFTYFNFNMVYINMPIEKIYNVYFPICFRKKHIHKKELHVWHDFINNSTFKPWGVVEVALVILSAIIFIFLTAHYYLF